MNIQLINFNILLGLSLTLICFTNDKSCSDRLYDIVNSVLKAADCDSATYFAKITRAHVRITFCLFKGKIMIQIFISTSDKLDVNWESKLSKVLFMLI